MESGVQPALGRMYGSKPGLHYTCRPTKLHCATDPTDGRKRDATGPLQLEPHSQGDVTAPWRFRIPLASWHGKTAFRTFGRAWTPCTLVAWEEEGKPASKKESGLDGMGSTGVPFVRLTEGESVLVGRGSRLSGT